MTTEKTSNDAHDFEELRHLLKCDNVKCGAMNPPKKCARCKSTYYCSVLCQKAHWKQGHQNVCECVKEMRAKLAQQFLIPDSFEANLADDAVCGICLEDTIHQPYTLPKCKHVFCFKCISDYLGPEVSMRRYPNECPLCRAEIDVLPIHATNRKSIEYFQRSLFFVHDDDIEEQNKMYHLATLEVDKVLEFDPRDVSARHGRAELIKRTKPLEAIKILKSMFETHHIALTEEAKVHSMLADVNAAIANGEFDRAEQLREETTRYTEQCDSWRCTIGSPGPQRLWSAHVDLAEAYEAAGLYKEASEQYWEILKTRHPIGTLGCGLCDDEAGNGALTHITLGIARVCILMENFKVAIGTCEHFVVKHRFVCGAHKVLAMALLGMAEKAETVGTVETTAFGGTFSATLDGAIEVAYKGFVYEEQWNDKNKATNRAFLRELLDKKAATEKAKGEVKTGESTDTTEAATDNIHAAAGIQARLPANTGRKKNGRKNKKRGGKSN